MYSKIATADDLSNRRTRNKPYIQALQSAHSQIAKKLQTISKLNATIRIKKPVNVHKYCVYAK